MRNGLLRIHTVINDAPISCLVDAFLGRNTRDRVRQLPHEFGLLAGRLSESTEMFAGNDQYVHRSLRVDIAKGDCGVILIDDIGAHLTQRYAAKEAVTHAISIGRTSRIQCESRSRSRAPTDTPRRLGSLTSPTSEIRSIRAPSSLAAIARRKSAPFCITAYAPTGL